MGYFTTSNIHPYRECEKRRSTLRRWSAEAGLRVIYQEGYDLEDFLRNTAFRESSRCLYCYHHRLKAAVHVARRGKFDAFSTTLLYSKFQNHEQIKTIGDDLGRARGVPFLYRDFREGWKIGVSESRRLNLYRQEYCGCIYSEKDRFFKPEMNP